jgi:hypothetical protein
LWFTAVALLRTLIMLAAFLPVLGVARAAELDGVQLPPTLRADGKTLYLNGIGLRTYSVLGIHIYVAGLYLQHPSTDPQQILESPETKLLAIVFERNVNSAAGRKAWRDGFDDNCRLPCHLDPNDVEQFLAAIPDMHSGDTFLLLFTQSKATVTLNGRPIGVINKPTFAEAMLATFLGPRPASERLKQALLAGHA